MLREIAKEVLYTACVEVAKFTLAFGVVIVVGTYIERQLNKKYK